MLDILYEWIRSIILNLGYVGICFLIALENIFPPIPSEFLLPFVGFLVGQGQFNFLFVLISATIGSVLGALVFYYLGGWIGEKRFRSFIKKYGKYLLLGDKDIDKAKSWFDKHGNWAVLTGRFLPGIRSYISLPAGINKMPLVQFVILTTIGSVLWNAVLISLGWVLGSQWQKLNQYLNWLEYGVTAFVVAGILYLIWKKYRAKHQALTD